MCVVPKMAINYEYSIKYKLGSACIWPCFKHSSPLPPIFHKA